MVRLKLQLKKDKNLWCFVFFSLLEIIKNFTTKFNKKRLNYIDNNSSYGIIKVYIIGKDIVYYGIVWNLWSFWKKRHRENKNEWVCENY